MATWFAVLAAMGAVNIVKHPEIIAALNPIYAIDYVRLFARATPYVIGSVDLCITGCEALYADMGHYFLGRESLVFSGKAPMSLPRKVSFKFLSNNAVPASAFFRLPPGRVIELGIQIEI